MALFAVRLLPALAAFVAVGFAPGLAAAGRFAAAAFVPAVFAEAAVLADPAFETAGATVLDFRAAALRLAGPVFAAAVGAAGGDETGAPGFAPFDRLAEVGLPEAFSTAAVFGEAVLDKAAALDAAAFDAAALDAAVLAEAAALAPRPGAAVAFVFADLGAGLSSAAARVLERRVIASA